MPLRLSNANHVVFAVVPRDSAWFSWYDGHRVIPLQDQKSLWHEDRLGLRKLHDSGRLHFEEVPGGHMQFSFEDLTEILDKYASMREGSKNVPRLQDRDFVLDAR